MKTDAIVLAGGRSTRLDGVPKARLVFDGLTLLEHALAAASAVGAVRIVVVGEVPPETLAAQPTLLSAREEPPFGGPAAALEAGLDMLQRAGGASVGVLVLSCDLPHAGIVARALVGSIDLLDDADALLAVDENDHRQQLVALYSSSALRGGIERARLEHGSLDGIPARALLHDMRIVTVRTPGTADVDTWEDSARYGIADPRGEHADALTASDDVDA